jgi:hypothetical protein
MLLMNKLGQKCRSDVFALGCIFSFYFKIHLLYILNCLKNSNEKFAPTPSRSKCAESHFIKISTCSLGCVKKQNLVLK